LEASSVNEVKDISWDFGDGGSVEGREAAYSYTLPGVFNVVLSGEAANGCKGVHMQEVHVRNNPQADFSIDAPPLSCSGNPTPFTDISLNADGVLEHWLWHFNGSDFSDLQNPEYTFDSEGSHDVSL